MREILFCGKRKDDGAWVCGFYCGDTGCGCHEICDINSATGHRVEVDPATVGQYTGLQDKNGKRIFEGDIVVYNNTPYNAYGHRVTGVIVWRKWMWKYRYKEYEETYDYAIGAEDFFGAKSEVIGNIHDNPELLEVNHED